jgi:hypothetical protein
MSVDKKYLATDEFVAYLNDKSEKLLSMEEAESIVREAQETFEEGVKRKFRWKAKYDARSLGKEKQEESKHECDFDSTGHCRICRYHR